MSRKPKYSVKEKLEIIEQYLNNKKSVAQLSQIYGFHKSILYVWLSAYRHNGIQGLETTKKQTYSKELKLQAVQDYLSGKGSSREFAAKYGPKVQAN